MIPLARKNAWVLALPCLIGPIVACRGPVDAPESLVEIEAPEAFSAESRTLGEQTRAPWWQSFGEPSLDAAVDAVLDGSLELEQAWRRLAQADASAAAAGAARIPTIDLSGTVQKLEIDQRGGTGAQIPIRLGETYSVGPSLSYELDLFGRIGAAANSARFAAAATEADAQATALALSGRATDAWLTSVENRALRRLIEGQVETGEQLLKLTRTRFGNGAGSALAVLQQQRLLESTKAELPRATGAVERAEHQLAVLAGKSPKSHVVNAPDALPGLPPLPAMGTPIDLLEQRPDLRAAYLRVKSGDRDVATAIAARYPRLSLSASYSFDANEVSAIFDRTITSIVGSLAAPLIDGGSRRAEVRRARARLDETVLALRQAFLVAVQEVEDALSNEQRGVERLEALERQRAFAVEEVEQARRRYAGGVDTYLQVLTAVQNRQALDRLMIAERAAVIRSRTQLLRALGGAWTQDLESQ